jgi:pimeloyl-ACP methyl ester carboxylesterase
MHGTLGGFLVLTMMHVVGLDGPADNRPETVRRIPPPGVAIAAADREELSAGAAQLAQAIEQLRKDLRGRPALLALLPDVQIYYKAVDWALRYDEFFDTKEVANARELLKQGMARAGQLRDGNPAWLAQTGLVVRGYQSRIDGSVQPYGLVVPRSYRPEGGREFRLDVWCHGRNEKLSELAFIDQRQRQPGEFTPKHAFVLHPYGRYCNANKFAGEVDLFEALDHVKQHYPIDDERLMMRGFSMGGAAAWHFAVHFPDRWAAATPGAGFSETPEFLRVFQNQSVDAAPWWEKRLWRWYNATDWAGNLALCPTIAYSGEIDKQKQAADAMAAAMAREGLRLRHIIGPQTAHRYHPDSKREIERRLEALLRHRLLPSDEEEFVFTTYTLRYPGCRCLRIDGLEEHWQKAQVRVALNADPDQVVGPTFETRNVTAFTIDALHAPYLKQFEDGEDRHIRVKIDRQEVIAPGVQSDEGWTAHFRRVDGQWRVVKTPDDGSLRKRPGLQGPIDDAFMDSFLVVKPSGRSPHAQVDAWVEAELTRFIDHWRRQFRGEPRVKLDRDVTDADMAEHHLIVWGVPANNTVIKKMMGKLPMRYADGQVHAADQKFDADSHAPAYIYPNPLNPRKYVVVNSGFTFRDFDYLNNARQVPKLPDWAVIDLSVPPDARAPGRIAAAGFFDEAWKFKGGDGR